MFNYKVSQDLKLRLLEERHAGQLFDLADRNRKHIREWMTWLDDGFSLADARKQIEKSLERRAGNDGFWAGIWLKGELAGCIVYNRIDWQHRCTEISYWLGAPFQGKGLVTQACRILINHAFDVWKLNRVEIRCAAENRKSRSVPERLGFTQEGILRQSNWLHDRFVDVVIYGMLASEWKAAANTSV